MTKKLLVDLNDPPGRIWEELVYADQGPGTNMTGFKFQGQALFRNKNASPSQFK